MKVVQLSKLYFPWIGGIENVVKQISEGLSDRIEMIVYTCQPKGKREYDEINDVKVIRESSLGIFFSMPVSIPYIFRLRKYIRDADIIHIHEPFPLADLSLILSGFKGKIIISWHGDIIKQKRLVKLVKPFINYTLKRADEIFVSSIQIAENSTFLCKYKEKCIEIPLGINISEYENIERKPVLSDLLINKSNKKVLFVGRLVYFKGVHILIEAFKNINGAELFIVGGGVMEQQLLDKAKDFNLLKKIHFLGVKSGNDLKEIFADCDFLVFPSINTSESFGIVQLEAMVYGKPVINTDLPTGVPSVSVHNKTGLTVAAGNSDELHDAIQTLVDCDDMRELFGNNAKERVYEKYSLSVMLNNVYDEYKKVYLEDK